MQPFLGVLHGGTVLPPILLELNWYQPSPYVSTHYTTIRRIHYLRIYFRHIFFVSRFLYHSVEAPLLYVLFLTNDLCRGIL